MTRFDNQTVLVTGGTGGQGSSHARAFHAEGANVVIGGLDAGRAKANLDKIVTTLKAGGAEVLLAGMIAPRPNRRAARSAAVSAPRHCSWSLHSPSTSSSARREPPGRPASGSRSSRTTGRRAR